MVDWKLFGDAKATAKSSDANRKKAAYDEAKRLYDEDPSPDNQRKLASTLFDLGRFEEAEKYVARLLATDAKDIRLLSDLGFIYKNLNRKQEAFAAFKQIVDISPKHSLARTAEHEMWMLNPEYRPSWMRKSS